MQFSKSAHVHYTAKALRQCGIFWQGGANDRSGKAGESYVKSLLKALHWEVVASNCRHIGFELDLVIRKGSTLAIVEVKFRTINLNSAVDLEELLPIRKQRALVRGARYAAALAGPGIKTIRFDLALVIENGTKEKRPAFQPDVFYFPSVFSAV